MHLIGVYLRVCISRAVHLTGVHPIGIYLTGVHLTGMHLTGIYLVGVYHSVVHLIGVYPMGAHLIGGHLMRMHLMGVYLVGRVSCRHVSYGRAALGPKLLRAEIVAEVAALILPARVQGFYSLHSGYMG